MGQVSLVQKITSVSQASQRIWECCKKCSLKSSSFVPGELKQGSKILVIGEAPGAEEAKQGRPFIGSSGTRLRQVLDRLGITDYSISNTVKCRPTDARGDNRPPTPREIINCSPMIGREVELYDFVVLVGGTALGRFVPGHSLGESVGSAFVVGSRRYYVVYHPAYIGRNPENEPEWLEDLERIGSYLDGSAGVPYVLVDTEEKASEAVSKLSVSKRLYVDIETSSLDRFDFQLYCIGIGDETDQYIFVFDENLVKLFNEKLFTTGRELVMHNAQFEIGRFEKVGLDVSSCVIKDNQILACLSDEENRTQGYGQKELARRLLGYKYWYMAGDFQNISRQWLYPYNAEDVYVLRGLHKLLWAKLSPELREFSVWVLSDAIKAVSQMESWGIKVDLDYMKTLKAKVKAQKEVLLEELSIEYGDINWNSPVQVGDLLVKKGVQGGKKTPISKRLSIDKESLDSMLSSSNDPSLRGLVERFSRFRELTTLENTFIDGISERLGVGGRIRSQYHFTTTVTGRLSSRNPNFQNQPRSGGIRELFVAEPGYKLLEGDLSQIELRIAAIVANEPVMLEAFRTGQDIHRLTASIVMRKDPMEVSEEERYNAKAVNFGFIYGAQWQTFQKSAKTDYGVEFSDQEAQDFRRAYFDRYTGLVSFHAEVEDWILKKGSIKSTFGRIRHLEKEITSPEATVRSHAIRQAINSPIQGSASDLLLCIIGGIRRRNWNTGIIRQVGTVHDQLLSEVREDSVVLVLEMFQEVVKEVQSFVDWFTVPLVMDWKVGDRWGQLKKL